jgi:putative multiple sugar transport system permease protein
MIGGLVMGVLNLGLANLSVDSNYVQIIKGLVLLGAVALDVLSKSQGRPSFIGMIINGITRGRGRPGAASATPVRADEAATPTGVVHVARTHLDDLPEGLDRAPTPAEPTKGTVQDPAGR